MEILCKNKKCNAPLLKSYGSTIKLRSKITRWDSLNHTAVAQCSHCRTFTEMPLEFKISKSISDETKIEKYVVEEVIDIKLQVPIEKK